MTFAHISVMVREAMEFLRPEAGRRYLDGTVGGGGHAEEILVRSSPSGRLLGLDRDDDAVAATRERLRNYGDRLIVRRANFADAKNILAEIGWHSVHGILLDLGVSYHQLRSGERGFGFQANARLDMRMDRRQSLDAHRIVNLYPAAEIERVLRFYGEEPQARRIASTLVAERKARTIETTHDLAEIVARVKGNRGRGHHPATKTFQALRIAVNQELENLKTFLEDGYRLLPSGGRIVVIAFHSLEDRLVKTAFRKWSRDCLCPPKTPTCKCGWSRKVRLLVSRPLVASPEETQSNPRARSAKLRAVERL